MNKSNVTITLYMSELLYEVQNKTYLTGRSRQNGQNHEEVANMQANDDDENLNQLLRSLQNAYATLKTKLSEYIVSSQSVADNEMISTERETLMLTLAMPTNYNHATLDTISSQLHQYIVNVATGDWFTITNKNDAADYVNLANQNLELVRESLNKRVRPERRGADSIASRFTTNTAAVPEISNDNGTVTITTATNGGKIFYTTDGSYPQIENAHLYNAALTGITNGTIIRAIVIRDGMYDSAVASSTIVVTE
ncbi:MAG: chitobiase/beta-hexosaminidase C-terminal domain-containing protein [Bacteroidaceae bacterium]|nr:chitobiase/beta-hexosaminidase C-terminal domain-containing protein [Bacteroidaceae bacterium]